MTCSSRIALLVDYGGVLTEPMASMRAAWCAAEGIDESLLSDLIATLVDDDGPDNPAHALERGEIPVRDFERFLAAGLRTRSGGSVAPDRLLERLFACGRINRAMVREVWRARRAGIRTALVSNSWGVDYPLHELDGAFDALVFSHRIGHRKPEPEAYLHAADVLGVEPGECVFVDDRAGHVDGAMATGMTGVLFADTPSTISRLAELLAPYRATAVREG